MTLDAIEKKLGIPKSSFYDMNRESHKRNKLAKLLLALDENEVDNLIKQEEQKKEKSSIYSTNTRNVKLNKKWFTKDLFWSSPDSAVLRIENIIAVYMNRPNQIDTDKLCELFGHKRVYKAINLYVKNNKKEAFRQLAYYESRHLRKKFPYTQEERKEEFLVKTPKQRTVDYFCRKYGHRNVLKMIENRDLKIKLQVKKMVDYYMRTKR